ncbi:MAG: DUF3857 domain-containing protein [Deltaproteobacteria bacterium]|nr:DUF3857 domain-containing protein [Deltaproteobacteria bacterium]
MRSEPPELQVLSDTHRIRYDESGARRSERHLVVRLLSGAAIDRWSKVGVTWSPTRSHRPELSLTIRGVDGRVTHLGPDLVVDEPMPEGPGLVRRYSSVELPGLGLGTVVEEHLVIEEHPSPFPSGDGGRALVGLDGPVEQFRVELSFPSGRDLEAKAIGPGLWAEIEEHDGRRTLSFSGGPFPEGSPPVALAPHGGLVPGVYYGGFEGWGEFAIQYMDRVEATLSGPALGLGPPLPNEGAVDQALRVMAERVALVPTRLPLEAEPPRALSEVLANRRGNALDRALVLLSALRAQGQKVHLALVTRGALADQPHPELADLSVFERALVALEVPGGRRYLDPIHARRHLPAELEGRSVLWLGPEPQWVDLPRSLPADNHYVEKRRLVLGEYGAVRVEEFTTGTGTIEDRLREQLEGASEAELRALLEAYVRTVYGASGLVAYRRRLPERPDQHLSLELAADEAMVGFTGTKEAQVQLRTLALYTGLPPLLRSGSLGDKEGRTLAERRLPIALPQAYSAEIEIEVQIPEGFVLRTVPSDRTLRLGPARYQQRFRQEPGRVVAQFQFDTGPAHYSADDGRALARGLRDLFSAGHVTLDFDHQGASWLRAGKSQEAIQEFQRLVTAHPNSAVHRARLAEALLELRLGEAARHEARAAVALDPVSGLGHYTLGWVLSHDHYGRQYHRGYDRAGAIAAFLRVIELEPRNREARLSLALLYEHDEGGQRYGDPEQLELAIGEYELLHADGSEVGESLLEAHFWAGHLDAVLSLAPGLPTSRSALTFELAALVLRKSPLLETYERALGTEGNEVRGAAAQVLVRLGRYAEALSLLERAGEVERERQAVLRHLLDPDPEVAKEAAPVDVLWRGLLGDRAVSFSELYGQAAGALQSQEVERLQKELERTIQSQGGPVPRRLMLDLAYGRRRYRLDGDPKRGYLVQLVTPGAPRLLGRAWLVAEEQGRWVLVASSGAPFSFGSEALRRLDRRDVFGARAVLDWARTLFVDEGQALARYGQLWPSPRPADPERIRVAAAALLATGPTAEQAIRILSKHADRQVEGEVLGAAYQKAGAYAELLRLAERRLAKAPDDPLGLAWRSSAWFQLGHYAELRALAEARLAERPGQLEALHTLAQLAMSEGHFDEARRRLEEAQAAAPSPALLNNLAWLSLLQGSVAASDLERAQAANQETEFSEPAELHTLAALHAERGEARPALELLARRSELLLLEEPEPADWYVIARILEGYGLVEAALRAYERADRGSARPDSTDRLAATRKARLLEAGAER